MNADVIHLEASSKSAITEKGSVNSRLRKLQRNNEELQKSVIECQKKNESKDADITKLKSEKLTLVQRLQEADDAFNKLTSRVHSSSSKTSIDRLSSIDSSTKLPRRSNSFQSPSSSNTRLSLGMNQELKNSLDMILKAIGELPNQRSNIDFEAVNKDNQSLRFRIKEEELRRQELEAEMVKIRELQDMENGKEFDALAEEYRLLQVKHSKCEKLRQEHSERKRLKKEKKALSRKNLALSQDNKMCNIMIEQLDSQTKESQIELHQLQQERDSMALQGKEQSLALANATATLTERTCQLDQLKLDYESLKDKLSGASEEIASLKGNNSDLLGKLQSMTINEATDKHIDFLLKAVENLDLNVRKMSSENIVVKESMEGTKEYFKSFVEQNVELTKDLAKCRNQNVEDSKEIESLKRDLDTTQKERISLQSEIERLNEIIDTFKSEANLTPRRPDKHSDQELILLHEATIESLTLEKDILSSRVVILESIREEMEILKSEKTRIQEENDQIKFALSKFNIRLPPTQIRSNSDLLQASKSGSRSNVQNHPESMMSMRSLDSLSSLERQKLSDMLSSPDYQRILQESGDVTICDHSRKEARESTPQEDFAEVEVVQRHTYRSNTSNHLDNQHSDEFVISEFSLEDFSICESGEDSKANLADDEENFSEEIDDTIEYVQKATTVDETIPSNPGVQDAATENGSADISENSALEMNPGTSKTQGTVDSPAQNHLERLLAESKMISNNIAMSAKKGGGYKELLKNFKNMIDELSAPEDKNSSSSINVETSVSEMPSTSSSKRVQFSDHLVEYAKVPLNDNASVTSEESDLCRSFFQESLQKNYPELLNVGDIEGESSLMGNDGDDLSPRAAASNDSLDDMAARQFRGILRNTRRSSLPAENSVNRPNIRRLSMPPSRVTTCTGDSTANGNLDIEDWREWLNKFSHANFNRLVKISH